MKDYPQIALLVPEILVPTKEIDMEKWAVVACDQFTSQPNYWSSVEKFIDESPSTYHLILPEAYLGTNTESIHAEKINRHMKNYLDCGYFQTLQGLIYIERKFEDKSRKGLIAALDLESYDFSEESHSLIRATEGTIVDRLPPRVKIRKGALLEIPHILVLIDDPENSVIEPILKNTEKLNKIYDFDLMMNSGHVKGYQINSSKVEKQIIQALENLIKPETQSIRYGIGMEEKPLLFAVGDGNHSLATAKAVWENIKPQTEINHPARYALVEIVNLHDPGIEFEAIHRLLIGVKCDLLSLIGEFYANRIQIDEVPDFESLRSLVENVGSDMHVFGLIDGSGNRVVKLHKPNHTLSVGSVQNWVDDLISNRQINAVDYIHGGKAICKLGKVQGNTGIYLPSMDKHSLFKSVIKDGPLPRKTFSMGEAYQKRFYLECRRIK